MLDTASRNSADFASCAYPGAPSWVSPVAVAVALMGPRPVAARRAVRLNLDMTTPFPLRDGFRRESLPSARDSERAHRGARGPVDAGVSGVEPAIHRSIRRLRTGHPGERASPRSDRRAEWPQRQACLARSPRWPSPKERGCADSNSEVTV